MSARPPPPSHLNRLGGPVRSLADPWLAAPKRSCRPVRRTGGSVQTRGRTGGCACTSNSGELRGRPDNTPQLIGARRSSTG
jgi:hypothetical protein